MIGRTLVLLVVLLASASPVAGQTDERDNRTVVSAFLEAVNARDYNRLRELIAPDMERHSQATPGIEIRSADDFVAFLEEDNVAIPDSRIEVERMVSEGDTVALWAHYRGTQTGPMGPFPPSSRPVDLDFAGFLRLADGKIAEMWVTWDNLSMLAQLGHLVPPEGAPADEVEGDGP